MKKLMALAMAAAFAAPAFAADAFYVGADIARTRISDDGVKLNATGGAVFAGYQFNETFGLELGYRNFGSDSVTIANTKVDVKGNALQLSVLGSLPLNKEFSVFGRLGVNRVEAKATAGNGSAKESDTKALIGVGLRYAVSKEFGLRVEFQKPESNTNVLSIGADIRF